MIKGIHPKLCEQGKIKIGRLGDERTTKDGKSTYRLPNKLDHFIITTTERDNTGNFTPNISLMEEIAERVDEPADHLTTIPVYLLFDDIDSNFYTTYNCYQGKSRICTGDGEKAILLKTGEEITCPCPRLDQDYKGPTPCKPYGRLSVVLQSMDIIGGAWVYRTTGWNSVQDTLGSLMLIKRVAGRLSGIPLMLKLFPKTTQLPRGPVTVYTVSLIFAGSALALAEEARQHPMIGHDESIAPDQTIETEEETEIAEEFYPPETDAERAGATAATVTGKTRKAKEETKDPTEKQEPTAAELAQKTQAQTTKGKKPEEEFPESPIDTAMKTAKEEKAQATRTKGKTTEKQQEELDAKTKAARDKVKAKSQAQAAAKRKKEEAKAVVASAQEMSGAEQKTEDTSGDIPPDEQLVIDEGEVLDGPPEDFGWV